MKITSPKLNIHTLKIIQVNLQGGMKTTYKKRSDKNYVKKNTNVI